jgi:hypothetical protein
VGEPRHGLQPFSDEQVARKHCSQANRGGKSEARHGALDVSSGTSIVNNGARTIDFH